MTTAANKTQIIQKASILLGSATEIGSIEDDTPTTRSFKSLWDIARRTALALHPWNFAIRRAALTRSTEVPAFEYDYQFEIPNDCLRWLPWSIDDPQFFDGVEEAGLILANETAINIRYIYDHNLTGKWSPMFVDVMAHTLAMELCEGKTALKGLRDRLGGDREELISQAKRIDGLASGDRRRGRAVTQSRWASARHRPLGVGDY